MTVSMPVVVGALLAGAIVIDYGAKAAKAAFASAGSGSATSSGASSPVEAGGALNSAVQSIAAEKGWTAQQVNDWLGVIAKEDSLALTNPTAALTVKNPSSDAIGIAQGITGPGWYAQHGGNFGTVTGQLTAMANYIEERYGNPSVALAHENTAGWY